MRMDTTGSRDGSHQTRLNVRLILLGVLAVAAGACFVALLTPISTDSPRPGAARVMCGSVLSPAAVDSGDQFVDTFNDCPNARKARRTTVADIAVLGAGLGATAFVLRAAKRPRSSSDPLPT
jgi:hypothetical protein